MARLIRVSIKGTFPSNEVWSVNPVYGFADPDVVTTPTQMSAAAAAVAAVAVPANLRGMMSTNTRINSFRLEARTAAGVLENLAENTLGSPVAGTGTTPHTFQTAWCSSLRTTVVGASGRGRLYWPATGVTVDPTSMRPTNPSPVSVAGAVQTYLSGIETALNTVWGGLGLGVWSRKNGSVNDVSTIQVGDVLDIQRRRRDSLIETYVSVSY